MSLLDQALGALAGGQSGDNNALLQSVLQLVDNPQNGGLEGIIQSFQQGGLGEIVNSWVSTGQNLPISAEQIQSILGGVSLSGLAAQRGVSPEQVSDSLADVLPQLIDQMTPDGKAVCSANFSLLRRRPESVPAVRSESGAP